jgi:hypothetical protein
LVYGNDFLSSSLRLSLTYSGGCAKYGHYHRIGEKNLVRAFMWCLLSEAAREARIEKARMEKNENLSYLTGTVRVHKNELRKLMTRQEINEAGTLAIKWHEDAPTLFIKWWREDAPEWIQNYVS